ncbi:hypothetical protein [Borrelia turicatae]|uniref:hypothetical protein n=1 Tax=Borrelia turicatae TaxID=142 RepID=UPI002ED4A392
MNRSILSVCMLTLLCLLSCDINALNELLDKAREKFLEENKKVEDLKSRERNQEIKEEQVDIVVRIEEGVEINKNLQQEGIELDPKEEKLKERVESQYVSQINRLTEEEESSLVSYDNEASDIKIKVNAKLVEMNVRNNELTTSLSKLDNMEADIMNAKSDFENARKFSGSEYVVKQALHQAIDKVKSSRNIAMAWYKEQLNALEHAKSYAEHAKIFTESALGYSAQVRSDGYYGVYLLTHYMSGAKTNLSGAENMFAKVESAMGKLRNTMKEAEEDFAVLKRAHKALSLDKK